ncbi:MAG TPA: endopeptidase La [bacterium]|nr:endopeptidase La [bacterium]
MAPDSSRSVPLLPLRDAVVFPTANVTFKVGREFSKRAIEQALREPEKRLAVVAQRDTAVENPGPADLHDVGTLCAIIQVIEGPGGVYHVFLEGLSRVRITETVSSMVCLRATVAPLETEPGKKKEIAKLRAILESTIIEFTDGRDYPRDLVRDTFSIEDDERFLDQATALFVGQKIEDHQRLLATSALEKRYQQVIAALKMELELRAMEDRIEDNVRQKMENNQKEYYLNERKNAIENELRGKDAPGSPRDRQSDDDLLRQRIKNLEAPEPVKEKLREEFDRYQMLPPMSSESSVARIYIDTLLALPWQKKSDAVIDINRAEAVLENDHFGLTDVKKRILEYLAVVKLSTSLKAPILCLVGPPGVGKTSIAASIARATGRQFVRTSLGGVRDEAEIRGHRRTYIGSMPGRIIQSIRKVKVMNPLFLLDELDKLNSDYKGDPAAALLEVLDPEQNHAFMDHYVDIEFDLSQVLFVATANDEAAIPRALHDRLEIIRIEGYTYHEKKHIARKFLLEKQKKYNGLNDLPISITEPALTRLIDAHTSEAGVRELERKLAAICRRIALERVKSIRPPKLCRITEKNIEHYLGPDMYTAKKDTGRCEVGVVNGLAWTPYGGAVLTIEAVRYDGKGNVKITGSLGEVMKESVSIAVSLVRIFGSRFLKISEEAWEKSDLHIHFPEGAVPKDGPSAGLAVALAIASVMTGIPVRQGIAMTGEVTLRGNVLRIGGLQAKLMAAKKAGIKTVYIPKDNAPELSKIPQEVRNGLHLIPVDQAETLIAGCLVIAEPPAPPHFEEPTATPQ